MVIRIRTMSADRQIHTSGDGKVTSTRLVVDQNGCSLKGTVRVDFAVMSEKRADAAAAELLETVAGALEAARELRRNHPSLFGTS